MNIEDHPKIKILKLRPEDTTVDSSDLTTTKITKGLDLVISEEPIEGSKESIIARLGVENASVFTTLKYVGDMDTTSLLSAERASILTNSKFIRLAMRHYIGCNSIIPVSHENGFQDIIPRIFGDIRNADGTIGINERTPDEISTLFDSHINNELIEKDGSIYLQEHHIYLPFLNTDLNRSKTRVLSGDDYLTSMMMDTLRVAKDFSSSRTYASITLTDGTEFILWYSEFNFGLITENF